MDKEKTGWGGEIMEHRQKREGKWREEGKESMGRRIRESRWKREVKWRVQGKEGRNGLEERGRRE